MEIICNAQTKRPKSFSFNTEILGNIFELSTQKKKEKH